MKSLMKFLWFYLFILVNTVGFSQNSIMIHQGEIEFEKRVNVYAILDKYFGDEREQQFSKQYKDNHSKFKTSKFILSFNDDCSIYAPRPGSAEENKKNPFLKPFAGTNIVYSDLKKNTSISEKDVLGNRYIVEDSIRKIQWRITNEIKEIAGFACRRANAMIMDSLYVVAFYTDEIVPNSGPESFSGLPGMILGVAIPYEHTTWFATKVIDKQVLKNEISIPKGKTKINNIELMNILINEQDLKRNLNKRGLYFHTIIL